MQNKFIVRAEKIITVSNKGTIYDGAIVIENERILDIDKWQEIQNKYKSLKVINFKDNVITPSLVDCHTHILEYAPSSLYSVTQHTHFMGGISLLLHALSCGVTALGEQICGHPQCDFTLKDYKNVINNLPLDISFSTNTISIGLEPIIHFTSLTGSKPVNKDLLIDEKILEKISDLSEYPGENIFINATPANLCEHLAPNAGNIIYKQEELNEIVNIFHRKGKKIGAHVGGPKAINMALESGVDILHHGHGMDDSLIQKVKNNNTMIVVTPIGGTHHTPNSPEEIVKLVINNIVVAVATDSYLPPSKKAKWLNYKDDNLKGPEELMTLAQPAMKLLFDYGLDENYVLSLITLNGAKVLGKNHQFGSLKEGMYANFLVADRIPGLEFTDVDKIHKVYFKGNKVIDKKNDL